MQDKNGHQEKNDATYSEYSHDSIEDDLGNEWPEEKH